MLYKKNKNKKSSGLERGGVLFKKPECASIKPKSAYKKSEYKIFN